MANFVIHFKSWVADGVASEVNNFNMHVSKPETHLPIYQILFSADGEKTAEEEDEDLNGTGQLKKDVGFLFSGLEQEFEESKSARAKLRERIKKVKTAIKEADDSVLTFLIRSLNLEWADLLSSNSCSRSENRKPTSFFNCTVPFSSSSFSTGFDVITL